MNYEKKYHSIVKKLWAHDKYAARYLNTKMRRGILLPGAPIINLQLLLQSNLLRYLIYQ